MRFQHVFDTPELSVAACLNLKVPEGSENQVYSHCFFKFFVLIKHTIYTRNNMGQKCEGNCGLWVLNEILKKTYPENLKKIVGAVWELPAR